MHIPLETKRSHIIKIRVNLHELTDIKTKAGASATAEWLRNLAMNLPLNSSQAKSRHRARAHNKNLDNSILLGEIGRIGNNLNQLVRAVNINKNNANPVDLINVAAQLNLIWNELHNVQQNI